MKQVFALLGERLGHSWSPLIHRRIFEALGVEGSYVRLEVERASLPEAVGALRTLGFSGANVTIPYKQEIMAYLDELSVEAARIGAVNTILLRDGRAVGYNTDYFGFLSMLEAQGIPVTGRHAAVLGTGGAAAAVIAALTDAGAASVTVVGRDAARLEQTKERFPMVRTMFFSQAQALEGELLVNTTPVGMYPAAEACPVTRGTIGRFSAVADCIYNPTPTLLARTAGELGIPACCGRYMLVFQAVKAQELWQGRKIPAAAARGIYEELKANHSVDSF